MTDALNSDTNNATRLHKYNVCANPPNFVASTLDGFVEIFLEI